MPYCLPCIPSEYQNQPSQIKCSKCAPNTFSAVAARNSSCEICPKGYSSDESSMRCSDCSVGKYGDVAGISCKECPIGWYQDSLGQTSCVKCKIGEKYVSPKVKCQSCEVGKYGTAELKCIDCPRGQFRTFDDSNSHTCTECPTGYATNFTAKESCSICQRGQYQQDQGQEICQKCPGGWLQEEEAKTKCEKAKAGKIVLGGGATSVQVPDGSYLSK